MRMFPAGMDRAVYCKHTSCDFQNIIAQCAAIAQLVERILGKDEVSGSNPDCGSKNLYLIKDC